VKVLWPSLLPCRLPQTCSTCTWRNGMITTGVMASGLRVDWPPSRVGPLECQCTSHLNQLLCQHGAALCPDMQLSLASKHSAATFDRRSIPQQTVSHTCKLANRSRHNLLSHLSKGPTLHEFGFTHMLPAVWAEVMRVAHHMRHQHAQPARHERPHAMCPAPRLPARPMNTQPCPSGCKAGSTQA
jgi:hypothetical protein